MNRSYRSLWNDSTGTFVAVLENASSAGKKTSSGVHAAGIGAQFALQALAVSVMLAFTGHALAQPAGGVVAAGAASISTGAGNTTINQSSQNAVINWQSFNIAAGQSVQFVQPGSSSVALNRVLGGNPSSILGSLTANGKVFLVNPNGILFGKGASVNVGALVASTLNLSDADFMAGNYKFGGAGSGAVQNSGAINADGGYVALLGANVGNDGVISAQLGTVALAAGNAVTLDVAGDGLLNVRVDQGAVDALVQNGGLIQADGGQVLLTAQSASALLPSAVNNTGVVRAQTLVTGEDGSIMLMGDMQSGTVNVGGTLDASAPVGGNGGFVETSAAYVKVANDAKVTTLASAGQTGTWLIDPFDYTVAALGGDITGASLGSNLESSNVTLDSNGGAAGTIGNVNVNDAVSWTALTTLTMKAFNDVNINAAITGTNGSVVANAGNNVNVRAATKTTTGSLKLTAVNDVAISAATTIITGNLTAVAGHDVTVSAASSITTGDMILHADNDGTGPGVAAGTVAITCGSNCLTITTGNLSIRFNPVSYASTGAEILAYGANLTGAGALDAKAWVFGQGDNKMYDNTTAANVSGLRPDVGGVAPPVALGAVTNANFDTEHVGINKPITYNTTFNDAVYALFAPETFALGTYLARGNITVRPLTVNAVTDTKQYDGTTSSVGTPTVVDLQTGDTLNGTLAQTYASKNVLGTNGSTLVASGPYTVSDGNGGNNYTVTVNTAPGTITPAPLTLQANDATKRYGQTFTPTNTAFTTPVAPVAGEAVTSVLETTTGSAPTANVAGSTYPIVITPGSATGTGGFLQSNYNITYVDGALTVTRAPLTLKANDATKDYGQTFTPLGTAFTVEVAPQNGETVTSVAETTTGTAATTHVADGPYPILITPDSATGTVDLNNYIVTLLPGILTVNPVPLTLQANDQSKEYGTAFPIPGTAFVIKEGLGTLKNDDSIASVTMTSTGTPAIAPVDGSPYPIIITPGSETGGKFVPTDYLVSYLDGKMIVTRTPAVVPPVVVPPVVEPTPIEPTPVETTPIETTPIETTPIDTTPIDTTPVDTTPVETTPIDTTPVELIPGETGGSNEVPPELPYEGPTVRPRVNTPTWVPVVVRPVLPPQLVTVVPPVPPVSPVPLVPVPEVVTPVPVVQQPIVEVPENPPKIYLAPKRVRKQDRN